ncbi:MAG: class I SAM-dependent methyltransferase [Pseudomonadota bacterium]
MSDSVQSPFVEMFNDAERAASYAEGPALFMPGFSDVHRMVSVLLRERVSEHAKLLVHGAGGGLELDAFARANPNWKFLGVDPARAMVAEAEKRLAYARERVEFHRGFIDDAPAGPFDAATSLLTLHFLERDERRETVEKIVQRLKPGAPFVAVHSSFPQSAAQREAWLDRYQAFAVLAGADPEMAEMARDGVSKTIALLDPEQDEQTLRDAGLQNVIPFYAAFTWRGWIGYAP